MTGAPELDWHETVPIPALLRHARSAYGKAMRVALADIGCDDVPKNGLYVIGGLAMGAGGVPLSQLVDELEVSRQAASQLLDALVSRGYLERAAGSEDPARISISLTARGHAAAAAQAAARERVDAELTERVGPECVAQMRKALAVLCGIGHKETRNDH